MTETRTIIATTLTWNGIDLAITYEPDWLNFGQKYPGGAHAHLEIEAADRQPLPITETGYRSHFLHEDEIDAAGGPAEFVEAWLNLASTSREWREAEERSRQLTLF